MHTLASRMSARERELAPRYYYISAIIVTQFLMQVSEPGNQQCAQDAHTGLAHEHARV
jgi:hypothetical protein